MIKLLTASGGSLALIISKEMTAHLALKPSGEPPRYEIDVQMERGRIVLSKPEKGEGDGK